MLRLILENRELELDENIQFAITRQFEDITNPTTIINDWSKTVRIPSTPNNDKIFGHIFSVDKTIVEGSNKLGIYFNPYKKIDFRLVDDSNVILTGYAKNISVDKDYYNLTLNGELGKVFQEMKKITFDTKTDDTKYLIDGSKYVKEQINKDLVYDLWNKEGGLNTTLYTRDERDYRIEEIFGFIPNNGYSKDFDSNTFQLENENKSKKFSEVLDEKAGGKYEDETGIAADTVIGNGLLPREIGEYRSYLQQPYIFFNKLFQIFTTKTEELTGYKSYLHPNWFNNENPYWAKLVYMLEQLDQTKSGETENEYTFGADSDISWDGNIPSNDWNTSKFFQLNTSNISELIPIYSDGSLNLSKNTFYGNSLFLDLDITGYYGSSVNNPPNTFNPNNYLLLQIDFVGNTTIRKNVVIYYENSEYEIVLNAIKTADLAVPVALYPSDIGSSTGKGWNVKFNLDDFGFTHADMGDSVHLEISARWGWGQQSPIGQPDAINHIFLKLNSAELKMYIRDNYQRSGYEFTLNDLWNNEFNLFNEILNYCKQYRIGIFCDYVNKQLIYIPLSEYFKDFTIEDWTNKVDYSREYHIEPITFQNKYILFNYDKYDTELNKKYSEKYGLKFGEYKLSTDYEFNNDTKSIFEKCKITIPSTDTILSWGNLYNKLKITYTLPAEITIDNKDKDNKNISVFGSLLFYKGLHQFDTTSGLREVIISDDTSFQMLNETYFYTQKGQEDKYINISTYPLLDISLGNNICTYTTPKENFTYDKENYNNKLGIYDNFWKNYINERYNIQNKIVTCYVYLKPNEFADFKFNKFVKINNQLYFVNKIYDYDIDATTPTKVDLITVQDIEGYTKNEFDIFNIYLKIGDRYQLYDGNLITIPQHSGMTIYITSLEDVYWSADSGIQNNLEINGEVGYGVISKGGKVPVYLYNDEYGPVRGYIEFNNGKEIQKIYVNVE